MKRRGLLGLLGGALAAPALIRPGIIMPVRSPRPERGIMVDWAAGADSTGYAVFRRMTLTHFALVASGSTTTGIIRGEMGFAANPADVLREISGDFPGYRAMHAHLEAPATPKDFRGIFEMEWPAPGPARPPRPPLRGRQLLPPPRGDLA